MGRDALLLQFARYAESVSSEYADSVYSRACNTHLPKKPYIHTSWAVFAEQQGKPDTLPSPLSTTSLLPPLPSLPAGNVDQARAVLKKIDSAVPGLVCIRLQRVALEVRAGRYNAAAVLYESSIAAAEDSEARVLYSCRYARLISKVSLF